MFTNFYDLFYDYFQDFFFGSGTLMNEFNILFSIISVAIIYIILIKFLFFTFKFAFSGLYR